MRGILLAGLVGSLLVAAMESPAEARDISDCMLAWHRAVSSYLTQNRTGFPEAEKMTVFEPACQLEQQGDKAKARVEAIMLGAIALAELDSRGCRKFMESYAGSNESDKVCTQASKGASDRLRKLIKDSIPSR